MGQFQPQKKFFFCQNYAITLETPRNEIFWKNVKKVRFFGLGVPKILTNAKPYILVASVWNFSQKKRRVFWELRILSGALFLLKMPKNALKMVFLAFFSISKRRDQCYGRFGTFWGPKNLFLMPKNTKKRIWIFCLFLGVEMTSRHKNSSKTLSNTPKMVQNYIKGVNIYIGRPSKKKNQKIWTQGKSCFFTVNATSNRMHFFLWS